MNKDVLWAGMGRTVELWAKERWEAELSMSPEEEQDFRRAVMEQDQDMTNVAALYDEPPQYRHVTVMADEVLAALAVDRGGVFLDVTAGGGGHSRAILEASESARVIAFDRDPDAIAAAQARLGEFGARAQVVRASFDELEAYLRQAGVGPVAGLIAESRRQFPPARRPFPGHELSDRGPFGHAHGSGW